MPHPTQCRTFWPPLSHTHLMANPSHDARIELAIVHLKAQDVPKYRATAREFDLVESTLRRRFKGQITSKRNATSEYHQNLPLAVEESLITQIYRLTDRGIPPTSRMVRNFAKEIISRPIGKNWTGDFVKRYLTRLKSQYLRNIDKNRINAEYAPQFEQFYAIVLLRSLFIVQKRLLNANALFFIAGRST